MLLYIYKCNVPYVLHSSKHIDSKNLQSKNYKWKKAPMPDKALEAFKTLKWLYVDNK
jgi:hypothetical protein